MLQTTSHTTNGIVDNCLLSDLEKETKFVHVQTASANRIVDERLSEMDKKLNKTV